MIPHNYLKRILQTLNNEQAYDSFSALDSDTLSQKVGLPWGQLRQDVGYLEERGYLCIKSHQIRAFIYHSVYLTQQGNDLLKGRIVDGSVISIEQVASPKSSTPLPPFTFLITDLSSHRYHIHATCPDVGDVDAQIDASSLITEIEETLNSLEDLQQIPPSLQGLPGRLYQLLFPSAIAERLAAASQLGGYPNTYRPILLNLSAAPLLVNWPWELIEHPSLGFLALSRSTPLLRVLNAAFPDGVRRLQAPLSLLGVSSAPNDLPVLDVVAEVRAVREALSGLGAQQWIDSGRVQEVQRTMRQLRPNAAHFVGHGGVDSLSGEGFLFFCDESGAASPISASKLRPLFADSGFELLFLNACRSAQTQGHPWSTIAASLVRRGVPNVVAMQFAIENSSAVLFATSFYQALADGYDFAQALTEARIALDLNAPSTLEWATPLMYVS